ncbi:hypothetical protein EIN_484720, partial [Entamoeba invadens IP1]
MKELQSNISVAMENYNKGLFENPLRYLDAISILYIKYNLQIKCARANNSFNTITRSKKMKLEIEALIEEQEQCVFDEEGSELHDSVVVPLNLATESDFSSIQEINE